MIDLSKIKVGDEVTVRAKVFQIDRECPSEPIRLNGGSWVNRKDILTHTPAPREFKPGDTVYAGSATKWKIEHVNGPWAWIVDANRWNRLEALENLRHADESE